MKELMIFEGKQVEVFDFSGQVLFNPYNVAECLDIKNVRDNMARMNEKQVVKLTNSDVSKADIRKLNNAGENFLTESGVYKLIFKSHKAEAKKFQDWVTDEVIPTIRKTGSYTAPIKETKQPSLGSVNMAVKNIMLVYKAAGVDPRFTALAISEIYREKANISLTPPIKEDPSEMMYDKTAIAKLLGVMSLSNMPHAQAIGAIIETLGIPETEKIKVPYNRHGHSGFDYQFKPCVVEKILDWLEESNYPKKIQGNGKTYKVDYSLIGKQWAS
ncbi:MAG: hypothetical protein JJE18_01545 [Eubacteriaceae bacterium]|nr:hypothetical protein [Eubacteriaceae bacterium]